MDGCQGGDFSAAASFENKGGPNLNANDPYTQQAGACKELPTLATAQSYTMVGEGNNPPTFKDLAYSIGLLHHMLSVDVAAASGDWENYSDGIYNDCQGTANDVDHMINMVGYNCETSIDANGDCLFDTTGMPVNHDGYLLLENNWGETWGTEASNGMGGYMKTRMYAQDGSHCNAIATDALYFDIERVQAKKKGGFLCGLFQHFPWCKA
jgi:C1A family cysteine protease